MAIQKDSNKHIISEADKTRDGTMLQISEITKNGLGMERSEGLQGAVTTIIMPTFGIVMSHMKPYLDSCKRQGDESGCMIRMLSVTPKKKSGMQPSGNSK